MLAMTESSMQDFSSKRKIVMIFVIMMAVCLIIDTGIIKTTDLVSKNVMNYWQVPIFLGISIGLLVSQFFLLYFLRKKSMQIGGSKHIELNIIWKIVFGTQLGLSILLILLLSEVLLSHRYNTLLVTISTIISYQLAIIMMGILTQQFFSWFAVRKNLLVLIYGLASAVLVLNSITSLAFIIIGLSSRPDVVGPHFAYGLYTYQAGSLMDILNKSYTISAVVSFILMWVGTSLILRSYAFRLGNKLYWVIACIPLVYFLSQFIPSSVSILSFIISSNPVFLGLLFTLIFTFSKAIGGLMFAIAFYIASRSVNRDSIVRDYMFVAAFSTVLFFLSGQTTATDASYPPFGLISILATGLTSNFLFIGLYSSAVSVSGDISLRNSIRTMVLDQSKFLERIGQAQMEGQLQKKVLNLAKEQHHRMEEESGVESSMTESEVKQYLGKVINEIKNTTIDTTK
jgi:hypothetical protein